MVKGYRLKDTLNTFVDRCNGKVYVRECKNCYYYEEPFKLVDNGPARCDIPGLVPDCNHVCDEHKRN